MRARVPAPSMAASLIAAARRLAEAGQASPHFDWQVQV